MVQNVALLGATGSIGKSSLEVLALHPKKYRLFAATAHTQWQALLEISIDYSPKFAVVATDVFEAAETAFREKAPNTKLLHGPDALVEVAEHQHVDTVIAAIVGGAGLPSSYAAAVAGKRILLANKESLVMSGGLFMAAASQSGALVLPVDSEHNAIFQSLPHDYSSDGRVGVSKIWLTGSGGPFRASEQDPSTITPEQAVAHPNWSMGAKISVDSATMMNKGLEFIEACHMFNVSPDMIEVLVHPQSIVHSMVAYDDGSVISQMGNPDMKTPIAHCLGWPQRINANVEPLNLATMADLQFESPDYKKFPCLAYAIEAVKQGGDRSIRINAANEIAVASFLAGELRFDQIALVVKKALDRGESSSLETIEAVLAVDAIAREDARADVRGLQC